MENEAFDREMAEVKALLGMSPRGAPRAWHLATCRRCLPDGGSQPFETARARNRWARLHTATTRHLVIRSKYPDDYQGDEVTLATVVAAARAREARGIGGALRRVARWLWTGSTAATPALCEFCDRDHHVHDANTGRCITIGCECPLRGHTRRDG